VVSVRLPASRPAKLLVLLRTRNAKTATNNLLLADGIGEKEQGAFAVEAKAFLYAFINIAIFLQKIFSLY
jgi:hypothetical protein